VGQSPFRLIAEEKHMISHVSKSVSRLIALACVVSIPFVLNAQATSAAKAAASDPPSRWDIFAGYSYLHPYGHVRASLYPTSTPYKVNYDAVDLGGAFSGAYYFNRYVGAQVELGYHEWGKSNLNPPGYEGTHGNNDGFLTLAGGVILRYPTDHFTPFVHVLAGGARIDGPVHNPFTWGPVVTAGGGLDYETPLLKHHLAIRLAQVDYEYMHVDFGSNFAGSGYGGGAPDINALRVSAGAVFHVGSVQAPHAITLALSANPTSVYPGDPVTVTAMASGLNPKRKAVYTWFGDGVTGDGATATVATGALAPGEYTVKATVREGSKKWQIADGSTTYTVKAFEPPTVSCSANPSTIKPGETSTVMVSGVSPQNRPLTYSYKASAGTISGNGNTATFSSTGAPVGPVEITCEVTDDKGQTATAPTTVTIGVPVTPLPHTQALCSITFTKDAARPTRVDNEAKACLDEVTLSLKNDPNAKLVVVGNSNADEKARMAKEEQQAKKNSRKWVADPAAGRAVNTKAYLVVDKGVDASRISVATGTADGKTAENYLVPEGADFSADVAGTTPVHEATVKPVLHKPAAHAKHATKKAAATPKKSE
jgi:hypothetical protein